MCRLSLVLVIAMASMSGQSMKEKVAAAQRRWDDQRKAEATWPDNVRRADVGVTTTIVGPGAEWPCAPSKAQVGDVMKLWRRVMDENEPDSIMAAFADALIRTHSTDFSPMEAVKILDKAPGLRKIAVVNPGANRRGYQAVTANGCWVAAEAVVRPQ